MFLTSLLLFGCLVVSDSLPPLELHHASLPCPSPSPEVCLNSCPLSRWCYPTISSSAAPFSSCLQSLPASGSFLMSQLFKLGGQSIGVSASASVLPMNIQRWFLLGLIGLICLLSKGLSRVFSSTTIQKHQCGENFRHSVLSVKGSYSHWVKLGVNCITDQYHWCFFNSFFNWRR